MAKITPEELIQDVKEFLLEDLHFDPAQVPRFFVNNIFGRAFSHIVGWTGRNAKMLRCTESGELKVAPTTTGVEKYQPLKGNATDAWGNWLYWTNAVSRIDFFIWDNPALVQIAYVADTFGEEIEVPAGFYSVDIRSGAVRIKNKTAGQTARYQMVGWW